MRCNKFSIPYPNPAGATFPSPQPNKDLLFLHLKPDDFFKKLPKLVKINFGAAKVCTLVPKNLACKIFKNLTQKLELEVFLTTIILKCQIPDKVRPSVE